MVLCHIFAFSAHEARKGNKERARELGKGMGRATGKMILGGGILRDVPVFHELATCGESLGDMIGGGDQKSAEKRWDNYANQSFFGSAFYAAHEARMGNTEHASGTGQGHGQGNGERSNHCWGSHFNCCLRYGKPDNNTKNISEGVKYPE